MTRPDPGPAAGCAGMGFEHHHRPLYNDAGRWTCTDCGTYGNAWTIVERLRPLILLADEARALTNLWPVILLPSRQVPGLIGSFAGYDVHRLRTIRLPMVVVAGRV